MKHKIVVANNLNFYDDQLRRLESLGDVTFHHDEPESDTEWFKRCKDADIICTGIAGLRSEKLYELENKFLSLPFVGVDFFDRNKLKKRNITISYSPGCNKEAVAEWIIGVMLMHFRRLPRLFDIIDVPTRETLKNTTSLHNKNITILGAGNIGKQLGKICNSFGMKVTYFRRGNHLINKCKKADIVANCLSRNKSTIGLLDHEFFSSLKKGAYFVSTSHHHIYDIKALIEHVENHHLGGAADDAANADVGNVYRLEYTELLNHPKIHATPHIAWDTDVVRRKANDMVIDNVEAWINKKPINLIP